MIGYRQVQRSSAKRITIYSHKGGVGKTTLTVHLAYALAALGQKVLLIDADPQCSMSSYFVDADSLDSYLDESESQTGRTIWSGLQPSIITPESLPRIVECLETPKRQYLLLGDIRLSEFEESLNQRWKESLERKSSGFTGITALSWLVNALASRYNADFVFYDCGPNIGPLNRAVLLDCDFYIIPAACDEFSLRAIKTLGQTLRNWFSLWHRIEDLAPDEIYMLPGQPNFLGYIVQQFKTYGQEISGGYAPYVDQIDKLILSDIVPVFRQGSIPTKGYELAEIQSFPTIANASQTEGAPMWEVKKGSDELKEKAHVVFENLAKSVLKQAKSTSK